MTTEIMDCYVPEGNEVDSGPIVKENYEGIWLMTAMNVLLFKKMSFG